LEINTGFNNAIGSVYPVGAADANWTVVADPDPNTTEPRPAFVISAHPAWQPALPNTQWISSYSSASDETNGPYTFQYCFCLRDGFSNPVLNLSLRADDQAQVFLNGTGPGELIGVTPNPSHNTQSPFQITPPPARKFRVGRNCITVVVNNIGAVAMGLNLSGSITTDGLGLDRPACCNPNSQITGTKWNDLNGNGIRETTEPVLQGWTIALSNGATSVTDVHGNYYFTGLPPGTYTVSETQQSGWSQTFPGGTGSHTVTLAAQQVVTGRDFGNTQQGRDCEFAVNPGCPGQVTTFTDLSTGASNWTWNFGDKLPTTSQNSVQNPSHTYLTSGTFTVSLTVTVNGRPCTVTHVINIPAAPLPPVISGPTTTCATGSYSVTPQSGTSIIWSVTNGTIQSGQGTSAITVAWNPAGNGLVAATMIQSRTCCKSTGQILVTACPKSACCRDVKLDVSMPKPSYDFCAPGYSIKPTLVANGLGNITQITANILSASISYSSPSCGTAGPVVASFVNPAPENGFNASLAVPNGDELVLTAASASGVTFPIAGLTFNQIKLKVPPPPQNTNCKYTLSLCIKYTFVDDKDCKLCSIVRCVSFDLTGQLPPDPSPC
jgi:PKD repeat protein